EAILGMKVFQPFAVKKRFPMFSELSRHVWNEQISPSANNLSFGAGAIVKVGVVVFVIPQRRSFLVSGNDNAYDDTPSPAGYIIRNCGCNVVEFPAGQLHRKSSRTFRQSHNQRISSDSSTILLPLASSLQKGQNTPLTPTLSIFYPQLLCIQRFCLGSLSLLTWSWEALRKILEVKVLTGKILSRKGLTLEAIW